MPGAGEGGRDGFQRGIRELLGLIVIFSVFIRMVMIQQKYCIPKAGAFVVFKLCLNVLITFSSIGQNTQHSQLNKESFIWIHSFSL